MSNELLSAYRFFFACGAFTAGFQKISGIGGRTEPEYIHEGGLPYAYPLPGAKGSTGTLTMEKGTGKHPFYSESGFRAGGRISSPCSIVIMGEDKKPKRVFAFDNGMILSWEYTPLDAGTGELLISKLEIAHTGIYETPPSGAVRYTASW